MKLRRIALLGCLLCLALLLVPAPGASAGDRGPQPPPHATPGGGDDFNPWRVHQLDTVDTTAVRLAVEALEAQCEDSRVLIPGPSEICADDPEALCVNSLTIYTRRTESCGFTPAFWRANHFSAHDLGEVDLLIWHFEVACQSHHLTMPIRWEPCLEGLCLTAALYVSRIDAVPCIVS